MKIIKMIACLLVSVTALNFVYGQKFYNNSIRLHTGSYNIYQLNSNQQTSLIGGYYERWLNKNVSINTGYSKWRLAGAQGAVKPTIIEKRDISDGQLDTTPGTIIERSGYNMADVTAFYSVTSKKRNHIIKGGLGVSYCWGWNECIERRYYVFEHGWVGTNYIEKVDYIGVFPQLTYDYNFLKNRFNTGLDIRARKYFGTPYMQYDLCIHIGVNF